MQGSNLQGIYEKLQQQRDDIRADILCFLDDLAKYEVELANYFAGVESLLDVTYDSITPVNYPELQRWYGRLVRMLIYVQQYEFNDFYDELALLRDYVLECAVLFREKCRQISYCDYTLDSGSDADSINKLYSMEDF